MKRLLLSFLPCLLSAQAVPRAVPPTLPLAAPQAARVQVFQATAQAVRRGASVTLRWVASGAEQVRLEPLGLILPVQGEITHLVGSRTVYWLHVSNATGGQSVPLVVDLLPEDSAPAVPALPRVMQPSGLPEWPRLAELPSALPSVPASLAPPPVAAQAQGPASLEPRRVWIQFAATASARSATRLQRRLRRTAATSSIVLVRRRRSGPAFQLVRHGPFRTVQAARLRLKELAPAMAALGIRPVILVGPLPPVAPGRTTYLADLRP